MALVREFLARMLVLFAIAAATVSLAAWWTSLLMIRTAGTLNASAEGTLQAEVDTQLDRLVPGTSKLPGVDADIRRALSSPEITQALATSAPNGSAKLAARLSHLDGRLSDVLSGASFLVSDGRQELGRSAARLRSIATTAFILAVVAAAASLVLSPQRHMVLRHLAIWPTLVGGLAVVLTWALPALVGRCTRGGVHHLATDVLSGAAVVRSVVLECLIGGAVLYVASRVFELVGNTRVSYDAAGPVPHGEVV